MKTIALDISVLNEKNKTGIGVYTYQLIKNLLKINKKDKFILFGISTLQNFEYLKNIDLKKNPNVEIKIYKMPSKFFRRAFLLWQKLNWPKIESFFGPVDIFHSFNWNLPPIAHGKMVATVFDMTPFLFPKLHQEKTIQLDKIRLDRIKKYADLVITISQNSKKDFLKFSTKTNVEVIYPGVGENFLLKPKTSGSVLGKYNLDGGEYILAVGTLEPRKNIKRLINAYLKSRVKQKLVLAGNWGWEGSELSDMINENKDKIITAGYVQDKDLPYLYKEAFCLVYPSLYEGFGIPVLEAQACGCPVITSDVSSLPEAGGKGAIYVNPYSVEDIVRGIEIVKDKVERENLVKAGYENIKRFRWEESAKKLNFLYQQL